MSLGVQALSGPCNHVPNTLLLRKLAFCQPSKMRRNLSLRAALGHVPLGSAALQSFSENIALSVYLFQRTYGVRNMKKSDSLSGLKGLTDPPT